jgi:hypothetical protein
MEIEQLVQKTKMGFLLRGHKFVGPYATPARRPATDVIFRVEKLGY